MRRSCSSASRGPSCSRSGRVGRRARRRSALEPLAGDETRRCSSASSREAQSSARGTRARIVEVAEGNALFVEQLLAYASRTPGRKRSTSGPAFGRGAARQPAGPPRAGDARCSSGRPSSARTSRAAPSSHLSPAGELPAVDSRLRSLERTRLIHSRRRAGAETTSSASTTCSSETSRTRASRRSAGPTCTSATPPGSSSGTRPDELVGYHAEQAHRYRSELQPGDPELGRLASWAGERLAAAGIRAWKRADTPAAVNLLGRATALLSADDAKRMELLCELGVAQRWLGRLRARREDAGRGDRGSLVRARPALRAPRSDRARPPASLQRSRGCAGRVARACEPGDPDLRGAERRAGARAHLASRRLRPRRIEGQNRRLAGGRRASPCSLPPLRLVGIGLPGELGFRALLRADSGRRSARRCEELLDEATDRAGQANVLVLHGRARGDRRAGSTTRVDHVAEAATTYEEIGEVYAVANNSGRVLGRIEMLAGDLRQAERVLKDAARPSSALHDAAGLSTVAAELADALYVQGRDEEARPGSISRRSAPPADDVNAQWSVATDASEASRSSR